jgi:hypothetical protein
MNSPPERDLESVRHERVIRSLRDRTGAPLDEVRRLFAQELSRLGLHAKVRSYLAVLTASNVRALLRRKSVIRGK